MIKFFRIIRQNLLSQNKFSKYLLYAFGEIILVMIGILLAIQANQWNQERVQEKLEVKLLKEIQKGIQSDRNDVSNNLDGNLGHKAIYRNQGKCIQWLKDDEQEIQIDSLTVYFSKSFFASSFLIVNAPFDALKEFGLSNVTNDSLRKELQYLYDISYPEYRRNLESYYDQIAFTLNKGENYFEDWSLVSYKMRPYEIEELRKDRPFLFSLSCLRSSNIILILMNREIYDRQSRILEMIDQELLSKKE